jgi:hypothetical protein
VLIHAGDLTNNGSVEEIQKQLDWLASLPHREKIVIAGNHDSYFDPKSRLTEDNGKKLKFNNIHYLENKGVTLKFKGGRKLNFYGAPAIPKCGGSNFACVLCSAFHPVSDMSAGFSTIELRHHGRIVSHSKQTS